MCWMEQTHVEIISKYVQSICFNLTMYCMLTVSIRSRHSPVSLVWPVRHCESHSGKPPVTFGLASVHSAYASTLDI